MKTLVFANQKGGVGKTTILVHMAFYFSEVGKKVAVIDLDHQKNASFTLSECAVSGVTSSAVLLNPVNNLHNNIPSSNLFLISADDRLLSLESIDHKKLAENLNIFLSDLSSYGVEIVLIDTTPALGTRLATALMVADYVISPIELEVYSLQGIALMLTTIKNIRDTDNKKLNFLGMLPSRVDTRNFRHREHLKELREAYENLLLPLSISMRSSIADAVATKQPVWNNRKTSARPAAKEMKELGAYILQQMKGS